MKKTDQLQDVRVLALKRWNLPQTKSVLREQDGNIQGEYISFQSHHFIDILPTEKCSIPSAYAQIAELRLNQQKDNQKDVHIVQSMTILGRDNGFWLSKADMLYVTFIQLGNAAERDFDKLEKAIGKVIHTCAKGQKNKPKWALYYALDFCDLVLFTQNINLRSYHNILWHLALVRGGILDGIRDTFTMYGFHREYLKEAFLCIDSNKPIQWEDRMTLSVNLSLQSMIIWNEFAKKLEEIGISYYAYRTTGRYDVSLITNSILGTKALKLLRCLDELCTDSKDTVFGGYEVQFLAPSWRAKNNETHNAMQDRSFECAANELMDYLCEQYIKTHKVSADYVDETCRSLKALLKNGFSEEFVLSVFVSFSAFLRTSLLFDKQEKSSPVAQNIERMNRKYFTALNTLALCTMHNERQFIQAPAFNATYFDVPPKLLAFYSAAVYNVVETLWDCKEPKYRFVIAPDYREDIYVSPLIVDEKIQTEERLAVIRLCEQYFYNPSDALALLCHEIGHYMSNRRRADRTNGIFYIVGLSLLSRTPLIEIVKNVDVVVNGVSILHVLATSLSCFLLQEFNKEFPVEEIGENQHHLINVVKFLTRHNFGADFFAQVESSNVIVDQWHKDICKVSDSGRLNHTEFHDALQSIEGTLHTSYITRLYNNTQAKDVSDAYIYVFSIFARNIMFHVKMLCAKPQAINDHIEFCDNVIQAYSEAYADMRMAQVMGKSFSVQMYEKLLQTIGDKEKILCDIRHDALCQTIGCIEKWDKWAGTYELKSDMILQEVAIQLIHQYLTQCYEPNKISPLVEKSVNAFEKANIGSQISLIHSSINAFREDMKNYCTEAISSIRNDLIL